MTDFDTYVAHIERIKQQMYAQEGTPFAISECAELIAWIRSLREQLDQLEQNIQVDISSIEERYAQKLKRSKLRLSNVTTFGIERAKRMDQGRKQRIEVRAYDRLKPYMVAQQDITRCMDQLDEAEKEIKQFLKQAKWQPVLTQ